MFELLIMWSHILVTILLVFYSFLFKKNPFDIYYLIIVYVMLFHWTFFNGECFATYYFKKQKDKDYTAGSSCDNELASVFKGYEWVIPIIDIVRALILLFGIYFVYKRNRFSFSLYFPFLLIFAVYQQATCLSGEDKRTQGFLMFQEVVKYLLVLYGIVFFLSLRSR
jgi:hypothetical protein